MRIPPVPPASAAVAEVVAPVPKSRSGVHAYEPPFHRQHIVVQRLTLTDYQKQDKCSSLAVKFH
jgi:hypothetical protein